MPSFLPGFGIFAAAGAVAAAGPVLIHLLNRRRFRVVHWAAMDFLREALKRNRKILQLRDIALLVLRTAAILLFGMALAHPYFAGAGPGQIDPNAPVHAILIIDNSMSMAYRQGTGTLLDKAKLRARDLIEALPEGSRVTVLPLCGGAVFSRDAFRTKKDAEKALSRIVVVDRAGTAARAADLAREGMKQAADVPDAAKRVVFISDQQAQNWRGVSGESFFKGLPEVQLVDVSARNPENSWVSDFRVLDGLADCSTPTKFIATISHQGPAARRDVQVAFSIDGAVVQSKTIDLNPDQTVEVAFEHKFSDPPSPGSIRWATAKVSLPPDRLEIDDSRFLAVPVVAALPVVFVDQYGESEDPQQNRLGETHNFRQLLAPQTARGDRQARFVRVVQRRVDQLNEQVLRDARLVVVAGVKSPGSAAVVRLLREFVRQGGQLVIAAGADFDPAAWNEIAWLGGSGILPLPLAEKPLGQTPAEFAARRSNGGEHGDTGKSEFRAFSLRVAPADVSSIAYLQLPNTDTQEIIDSLREPTFFKAVVPLESTNTVDRMAAVERKRIEAEQTNLAGIDAEIEKLSELDFRGELDAAGRANLDRLQRDRNAISPSWLAFDGHRESAAAELSPSDLAERPRPNVVMRYDNGVPFLVERNIGLGHIVMMTTGFLSDWNDLPRKNAVWLIDRILRSRIEATLPVRNVDSSAAPILVHVPARLRNEAFVLTRPGGEKRALEVERHGPDDFGIAVADFSQRGIYRITGRPSADRGADSGEGNATWQALIAANGPPDESRLAPIDERALAAKFAGAAAANHYRWVSRGRAIAVSGGEAWGQDTWWWLLLAAFACVLLELGILAWPAISRPLPAHREVARC